MKRNITRPAQFAVILIIVLIVLLPISPLLAPLPHEDAGLFATIGWRITRGEVMYRDLWDLKTPMIAYLNALGFLLDGGTLWGIWSFQVLFTAFGLWLTGNILTHEFDRHSAILGIGAILIAGLNLWEGNLTEEFGLPFQMAIIGLYLYAKRSDFPVSTAIPLGIISGLVFLLKQTLIMLSLTVGILLIIDWLLDRDHRSHIVRFVGVTTASGLATLGIVALYFASQGALAEALNNAFVFNTHYVAPITGKAIFNSIVDGGSLFASTGLHLALIAAWLSGFVHLLSTRNFRALHPLERVLLIATPLEIAGTSLTRTTIPAYPHYFVAWLPVLGMSAAFLFSKLLPTPAEQLPHTRWMALVSLLLAMGALPVLTQYQILRNESPTDRRQSIQPALDLIDQYTIEDDRILVWGYTPALYFLTGHAPPTRFIYPFAVLVPGYSSQDLQREYVNAVLADPPAVIVDTGKGAGCLPSLNADERAEQVFDPATCYLTPELDRLYDFVAEHYELTVTLRRRVARGDYYVLISDASP